MESNIQALPLDIQHVVLFYIFEDASQEQLKLFRTFNSVMHRLATPQLFSTIHLSMSTLSFERLRNLAEKDTLAKHVLEIVFHRGSWKLPLENTIQSQAISFFDYRRTHASSSEWLPESRKVSTSDLIRFGKNFQEELESESSFKDNFDWISELERIARKFANLASLRLPHTENDPPSEYLFHKISMQQPFIDIRFFTFSYILGATRSCRIRHLSLDSVGWRSALALFREDDYIEEGQFAYIESLHLGFKDAWAPDLIARIIAAWERFLKLCSQSLRSLELDFTKDVRTYRQGGIRTLLPLFMSAMLKIHYFRLSQLELKGITMREDNFIDFMERHSGSLQSLSLDSWDIPPDYSRNAGDSRRGSILRSFWHIGHLSLNLKSVSLSGNFSSRSNGAGWKAAVLKQESIAKSESRPANETIDFPLRARLEDYMRGKAEFPFPDCLVELFRTGLAEGDKDNGITPDALDELPYKLGMSDESFQWLDSPTDL